MSRRLLAVVSMVMLTSMVSSASADVRLPAIFGDNMVLQRGADVVMWGWAEPGEKVKIDWPLDYFYYDAPAPGEVPNKTLSSKGRITKTVVADKDGKWRINLGRVGWTGPRLGQTDFPGDMNVYTDKNVITLHNVLLGDVWIGSGQSNMTMRVDGCNNAKEDIAAATQPDIRLFTVPQKTADTTQPDCAGKWVVCDPKTVPGFSAVLYFFGRDLYKSQHVPLGLIHSSWGGTPIEAWTSRAGYEAEPKIKPILDRWDAAMADYKKATTAISTTSGPEDGPARDGKPTTKAPVKPVNQNQPTCLYNAMIAPLVPLTIKGVIWYQGESNAGNAALYQSQMPAMIKDWRAAFGQEFSFFQVQLANYMARKPDPTDTGWARLREAQLKTWQADPKTGMAVIIDIGEAGNIHPKDKQDVGKRLALAARAVAYGEKDVVYSGPIYKSMKVDGSKVRLTFDHVGGGLTAGVRPDMAGDNNYSASAPPLHSFAVAGEDHKFVWADAKIDGNDVVVSSDKVEKPVAVRYGWADNPDCNLYNKEGLPASPFRTDDWPVGK